MLSIRPEQLKVFQQQADEAFVSRVVKYFKEEHPDIAVHLPGRTYVVDQTPEETLHEIVRNGIAHARGYGMSWESSLSAFVGLMLVVAPNFDEHPLIQRVLKNREVESDLRIEQLWEQTSEETWEAAKQNYDANAWHLRSKQDTTSE